MSVNSALFSADSANPNRSELLLGFAESNENQLLFSEMTGFE
tara:strand:+ start:188 stop:313 length:126 start_codon:yes stop_codon:yes gene_type:complete